MGKAMSGVLETVTRMPESGFRNQLVDAWSKKGPQNLPALPGLIFHSLLKTEELIGALNMIIFFFCQSRYKDPLN